ncbi:MAG: hypothetical protein K2J38_06280, partial [Muribaculaceae bacterium]|nr:hypothetical protein [Muribaculaceae bacterium]
MKKLFILMFAMLAACAAASAQTIPVKTVFRSDDWPGWGFDLSTDGTTYYNTVTEVINLKNASGDGSEKGDIRIIIYDDDFEIMEQITIKDAYVKADKGITSNLADFSVLKYDIPDIVATKGLYTNDGKWCVVVEKYNEDTHKSIAYEVYDQDGKKVGDLPSEEDMFYYTFSHGLYGKIYLVDIGEGRDNFIIVYACADGQNSLAAPALIAKSVQAWPNPLHAGETLTIDLPREAPEGTFITFTDMRGRVVDKTRVKSGANTFQATPRRMSSGAYSYTVPFG